MNPKHLFALIAVTAAVAVAATIVLRGSSPTTEESADRSRLFPKVAEHKNDVASIRVQRKDASYTLRRAGDAWGLEEQGGYPVQMESVRKTILSIADMRILEPKTADPARYEKLGLQDHDAEGSKSALVTLADAGGAELARLVVGKEAESKGAALSGQLYVRKVGDPQSYLVSGRLDLHEKATDWLQKEILKVTQDRVRRVEVRQPEGETLLVDRDKPETKDFTLHGVPEGKEPTYPTVANSMGSALEWVNLEDVAPADTVDFATGTGPIARFETFDGLVVTATLKDQDGKSYASFVASYEPPAEVAPAPDAPADATATPEGTTPPATAKKSPEEVQREVAELNARLSKWAYVISSYSRSQLGKKQSEMLKDKAPPVPLDDAPGAEGGGEDDPVIIPGDLPKEIQDQIKAHQESIGNRTEVGPPRPGKDVPPQTSEDAHGPEPHEHEAKPQDEEKPPQR